ncbi:MAG: hypothetical protein IIA72_13125 [Proteobacteria bacterium]|nr:hypothetical protein [Pseudomonadota bacterium]
MDENNDFEEYDDPPPYQEPSAIDPSALRQALCKLNLLGDDPYLRMQAFNLAIVDPFLMELEYQLLKKLVDEERTPLPEAAFLSAQSQMWIFAAYELMRTWRQRARDIIKWAESGGLEQKLAALEKEDGYQHFGRQYRAGQIRAVLTDPDRVNAIQRDLKRTHMLFARLEAIRICLAKHEVRKKKHSVALRPGYGWINSWCGALDYEIEDGRYSLGNINRRDIADEIRMLLADDYVPSDKDIASFDQFMRGPAEPPPD